MLIIFTADPVIQFNRSQTQYNQWYRHRLERIFSPCSWPRTFYYNTFRPGITFAQVEDLPDSIRAATYIDQAPLLCGNPPPDYRFRKERQSPMTLSCQDHSTVVPTSVSSSSCSYFGSLQPGPFR